MKVLCTRVEIRLVFRLVGLKEFQRRYWLVKVGFLYTEVTKSKFCLSFGRLGVGSSHLQILYHQTSVCTFSIKA